MSITANQLYHSILHRAADEWGIEFDDIDRDIGQQYDPVVRFLAGACASELERVYQHLNRTEDRLQERLAKVLLPEYFHLPQPAYALATATASSESVIIDENTVLIKEEEGIPEGLAFSPLFPTRILPATIKLIATENQIIDPSKRSKISRRFANAEGEEIRKIVLGIEAAEPITNWQGVSLFFDLRGGGSDDSEKARFFVALQNCQCWWGNHKMKVANGLPNTQLLLEDYLNGNERLQNQVRARYKRQFLIFTEEEVPENIAKAPKEFLIPWLTSSQEDEEQIKKKIDKLKPELLKKPLYWLEIKLSKPVELVQMTARLSIRLNAYPVVNRRLNGHGNGEHHYLQTNSLKWVPLQPKEDFVAIRRVYEEKPPDYQVFTFKPFADFKEERKPAYTLRYGGIGRWDEFNAWQRLAYVVTILQDNYKHDNLIQKAADTLSLEDIHHLLGKKIEASTMLQQPTRDIYVLLHTGITSNMRVRVEYWTSQGVSANGVAAKSVLKCKSKHRSSLDADSIELISTSVGGRDPLNTIEQLNAMKSALLSRGRIVTREDVKIFCKTFLQEKLLDIIIQDGVGTDPRFDFGMTRLLDVHLIPHKKALRDDWEGICQQIQTLLEEKSTSSIPIRVRMISTNSNNAS